MPSLTLDGRLIYFAHCPKAGGTSVERFMTARWEAAVGLLGWGWDRAWFRQGGERAGGIPSSPQHYVWTDAARVLPRTPDHVFAVVRDPVARMISEYRYQKTERLVGPFGRPLRALSFSTWLRVMLVLARRNPYTHDNHFRPQSAFLPETGVTVFRLEDGLEPVGDWLCGLLGGRRGAAAFPHDLKTADAAVEVRPSRQDLELIVRTYATDYRRFGYALPDLSAAPDDPHAAGRARLARALAPAIDRLYRRGLV